MHKLRFEVPYNFSKELIPFYKQHRSYIRFIYLPPYKDDAINTRTIIETQKEGKCYMPISRGEYEDHLKLIKDNGLDFVVVWQAPDNIITIEKIAYYESLGALGFIIGNDRNAPVIKTYNSRLLVIASLVQRICNGVTQRDFSLYDQIVLYYPFNRALNALTKLKQLKDRLIIMPNNLCHIKCPSYHHWFPDDKHTFVHHKDCPMLYGDGSQIYDCGFISPEHLYLFDDCVSGYKIQGREYPTEFIKYVCEIYFKRKSPNKWIDAMLGKKLSSALLNNWNQMSPVKYYNYATKDIIDFL